MTVGIGAIAQSNSSPKVVVAADRMVTVGRQAGVEYEDTDSKIQPILQTDDLTTVAVGAGRSTLLDEIFDVALSYAPDPSDVPSAQRYGLNLVKQAYQDVLRDSVEDQVLRPLNFSMSDLRDEDTTVPSEVQRAAYDKLEAVREDTEEMARIIVASVGEDGAGLYVLAGADFSNFTDTGYAVIGSGGDSARLTLIRQRYQSTVPLSNAVFSVAEAKTQAEERQGVGNQMDMTVLSGGSMRTYDQNQIDKVREGLTRIEEAERGARENVIDDWDV